QRWLESAGDDRDARRCRHRAPRCVLGAARSDLRLLVVRRLRNRGRFVLVADAESARELRSAVPGLATTGPFDLARAKRRSARLREAHRLQAYAHVDDVPLSVLNSL